MDIVSRDNKQSDNRDDYFGRFLAAPLSCDVEASSVDRQHHTQYRLHDNRDRAFALPEHLHFPLLSPTSAPLNELRFTVTEFGFGFLKVKKVNGV